MVGWTAIKLGLSTNRKHTYFFPYNTELGAVIDRNKDTRCITICIAIQVFHITIPFLAYHCTPSHEFEPYIGLSNMVFFNRGSASGVHWLLNNKNSKKIIFYIYIHNMVINVICTPVGFMLFITSST